MNEQILHLDISKRPDASQTVRVGQGDRGGTTIVADIYDNDSALDLTGKTVRFLMRLPGGRYYVRDTNVTASGNRVTYVVDEEHMCAIAGYTDSAYFEVAQGATTVASTQRFRIEVLRSALDGTVPGESYDTRIDDAIDNANEAADEARAAAGGTIPLMASNLRGGAKLGDGLAISSEVLSVVPLTTAQIDTVADEGTLTSNNVLNGTRLTYLWGKLRAAFAAFTHTHSASDVISGTFDAARIPNLSTDKLTSGTLPIARGGTGLTESPSMRVNLSSHDAADVLQASPKPGIEGMLPVAYGGTGQGGVRAESVIGDIATASTGCTITNATYLRWGEVAQLFIGITCDSEKSKDAVIATLANGKHPLVQTALVNTADPPHSCTAYNNGEIQVKSAVTAGTTVYVMGTYLVP